MIKYQRYHTCWGNIVMACTQRGICFLSFADSEAECAEVLAGWKKLCENECFVHSSCSLLTKALRKIESGQTADIPLDISGTDFQMKVWKALSQMPKRLHTYKDIGEQIGTKGWRAIGNALNRNPVAIIIPCHRVIASDGTIGGYRWGIERKRRLLQWERLVE